MKQIVHYLNPPEVYISVGCSALVCPVDHPDKDNVSNIGYVRTSEVLTYDPKSGDFETKNTLYKKFP